MSIEPDNLPAESYRCALEALEADNARRAEPRAVARALATLTAVCLRPADFDDAKVVLWSDRLREVLAEFPGEIALAVVTDWPKSEGGKFWPTENELRGQLQVSAALRRWIQYELQEAMEYALRRENTTPFTGDPNDWDIPDGLSKNPAGDVEAFCNAWRQRNPERAEAYLNVCRFGDDVIATANKIAQDMIARELRAHAPASIRVIGHTGIREDGYYEWAL